jgi:hypothetical protein
MTGMMLCSNPETPAQNRVGTTNSRVCTVDVEDQETGSITFPMGTWNLHSGEQAENTRLGSKEITISVRSSMRRRKKTSHLPSSKCKS